MKNKKIVLIIGGLLLIGLIFTVQKALNSSIIDVSMDKEKIIASQHDVKKHTPEEEKKAIAIDEYNFEQLEKAKIILEKISKDEKKFFGLSEFNKKYNTNIEPIKNCYYVSNSNGIEKYIFGFQLESDKYIEKNGDDMYSYPKYNLPISYFCGGSPTCSDDGSFNIFSYTI